MRKIFNFQFSIFKNQGGQALITLLFFMIIGLTIISAAVTILFVTIQGTTAEQQSQTAYYNAESGIEDTILRLLRDPSKLNTTATYTPIAGSTTVSVTITNTSPNNATVVSTGTSGNTVRKIQLQASYGGGILSYSNWREN